MLNLKKTVFFFVIALALNAPFTAHAKPVLDIKEITSERGLKAWLVEDHSVPVISLTFGFKGAGAINDPDEKQGLARLLSNTMDEGAGDLDSQSFQKRLRDLSIALSFSSARDNFSGELKTLTKNKDEAVRLMHLALTEPRFDEEPLERMRAANMARVRSSLADPNWINARLFNDVLYGDHPYAQNSGGSLTSLAAISRDDLIAKHKTLSKDKLVIAAAGDITEAELAEIIDTLFAGLPETAAQGSFTESPSIKDSAVFVYERDVPQSFLRIAWPGIDRADPDYQAAQVFNFIFGGSGFGSRLTDVIREQNGLTYGIYSYFQDYDYADHLVVSTSTKNESAAQMLSLIKQVAANITAAPVTDKELQDAKTYMINALPLTLTSTDQIAGTLLSLQFDERPIDYLDQRQAAIEALTPEHIQTVGQRILNTPSLSVLVGKPELTTSVIPLTELPNVD